MTQFAGILLHTGFYLLLTAAGAALGSLRAVRARAMPWMGGLQTADLMVMLFSLGVQMGSNEQVVSSLGSIGLSALALAAAVLAGSLAAVFLLRKYVLRLDRYGWPAGERPRADSGTQAESGGGSVRMVWWILAAVAAGMLAGYALIPDWMAGRSALVIEGCLSLMLFLAGLDMGRKGTVARDIRAAGLRALLIPLVTAAGTLAAAAAVGSFLPVGRMGAIAAAAGLGWYSLAPSLLSPYSPTVSAVCFLTNVLRELLSIVIIPFVARWVGYVECTALPGAAAMDSSLPVIVRFTSERMTVYALTSGVVLSLAVPVLVPFLAGFLPGG